VTAASAALEMLALDRRPGCAISWNVYETVSSPPARQVSALGLVAGLLYRDFRRERVNDKRPFFRAKLNENKAAA
jgi:hypothetical protein